MSSHSQVRGARRAGHIGPARFAAAVLAAGAAALLVACSSGTSAGSANGSAVPRTTGPAASVSPGSESPMNSQTGSPMMSGSGSPAVNQGMCEHVDSLRASMDSLMHRQMNASGAAKIRADFTNIDRQLAALKGHTGSALSSHLDQLSTSLDKVKKAVGAMSNPPTTSQVRDVITALSELKVQSRAAIAAMNAACPRH